MSKVREEREHAATGIRFAFVGHLVWGADEYGSAVTGDVEAWRCGRCKAMLPPNEDEQNAHAIEHARADSASLALEETRAELAGMPAFVARVEAIETAFASVVDVIGRLGARAHEHDGRKVIPGIGTEQARLVHDDARERRVDRYREAIAAGRSFASVEEVALMQPLLTDALRKLDERDRAEESAEQHDERRGWSPDAMSAADLDEPVNITEPATWADSATVRDPIRSYESPDAPTDDPEGETS